MGMLLDEMVCRPTRPMPRRRLLCRDDDVRQMPRHRLAAEEVLRRASENKRIRRLLKCLAGRVQ